MIMTQRFVQLAQADAAPSAILSPARNHNFRGFGFCGCLRICTNNDTASIRLD